MPGGDQRGARLPPGAGAPPPRRHHHATLQAVSPAVRVRPRRWPHRSCCRSWRTQHRPQQLTPVVLGPILQPRQPRGPPPAPPQGPPPDEVPRPGNLLSGSRQLAARHQTTATTSKAAAAARQRSRSPRARPTTAPLQEAPTGPTVLLPCPKAFLTFAAQLRQAAEPPSPGLPPDGPPPHSRLPYRPLPPGPPPGPALPPSR